MTGVRVRGAIDRSILGLSPAWRVGSPGRGRHPFKTNKAAHVVDEVRHSVFAPRANDADGAHELGTHAVLLITKYARRGREFEIPSRILGVRRQSFWDRTRLKIRESLAPLVCNIMRLADGAASGDSRWFFV
jgi:hypothetical protein